MKLTTAFIASLLLVACASAQNSPNDIKRTLRNKIFVVRGFPVSNRLTYSSAGDPESPIERGSWTLGGIKIKRIEIKRGRTVISGERVGFTPEKDYKLKAWSLDEEIRLEIEGDISTLSKEDYTSLFWKIFLKNDEDWSNLAPDYWLPYLKMRYAHQHGEPYRESAERIPVSNPGVAPPKLIYGPDPDYEEYARRAKFQGVVVLYVVVNEAGLPSNVIIQSVLGLGLDDKAVEAAKKWKFDPAKRDGKPVSVAINLEMSFNLY
jgi:TonB family protein